MKFFNRSKSFRFASSMATRIFTTFFLAICIAIYFVLEKAGIGEGFMIGIALGLSLTCFSFYDAACGLEKSPETLEKFISQKNGYKKTGIIFSLMGLFFFAILFVL